MGRKKRASWLFFGICIGDETFAVLGFIKSEGTAKLAADVCIFAESSLLVKTKVLFSSEFKANATGLGLWGYAKK